MRLVWQSVVADKIERFAGFKPDKGNMFCVSARSCFLARSVLQKRVQQGTPLHRALVSFCLPNVRKPDAVAAVTVQKIEQASDWPDVLQESGVPQFEVWRCSRSALCPSGSRFSCGCSGSLLAFAALDSLSWLSLFVPFLLPWLPDRHWAAQSHRHLFPAAMCVRPP